MIRGVQNSLSDDLGTTDTICKVSGDTYVVQRTGTVVPIEGTGRAFGELNSICGVQIVSLYKVSHQNSLSISYCIAMATEILAYVTIILPTNNRICARFKTFDNG